MTGKPVLLMILDGYGIGKDYPGNAVKLARTPNMDKLMKEWPHTEINASGLSVGLPEGQMGNSEVGHLNIGSGRIVYQDLTRITKDIEDGGFFTNKAFLGAIENAETNDSAIHLIGLVSDGGVHSHNTHIYALLKLMKDKGMSKVFVHVILDGRDVPPKIGEKHVRELQDFIDDIGVGTIATVSGRYYAMDRDKRWDRIELAYDAMTMGKGEEFENPVESVESSYTKNITDEFMIPAVIVRDGNSVGLINNNDSIIFFNFRPDRARQITRAFVDADFEGFTRKKRVETYYVTMTEYDKTIENVHVAYQNENLDNTLGEYVSEKGLTQLRIAETEKYAHVTFFFNGGREIPFKNEDRALIASPKVATYDLKPEMSAFEVRDEIIKRIESEKYDLIILNFANPDMVGHTGVIEAAVTAVETVDECMGEIVDLMLNRGGRVIVTADHGNAEKLIDEANGGPFTAHTTNKVPLLIAGEGHLNLREGILADIAPTILDLLGLEKPSDMTGDSLIIKK
ncbi:MAG: 2,3-bisphosphoglycerate-independent phosphoglycerate mutase [Gudongella sp.]|jgi:2,3-bisphosphoglycerate-independent phosphoglycerate mutase|nr:2,3-bisphosphoglycerate-independent phosphoglycerate mutase [Gudongella sp.]